MTRFARYTPPVLCIALLHAAPLHAQSLPRIEPNDNSRAAGRSTQNVTTLDLVLTRGMFHPDGPRNPGEPLLAFAEPGKAPVVPAPMLRVRAGSVIAVSVRNPLPDSTLIVYGLSETPLTDSLVIAPGTTAHTRFTAGSSGTYYYYATTRHHRINQRIYDDSQLSGAFIVDPATGATGIDRIFVITQWTDSMKADGTPDRAREVFMINGLSWPHTERLRYEVGEQASWRFINASLAPHPMHLHGFYYMVTARGDIAADTLYAQPQHRRVVTELMQSGATMSMKWSPEKPGNWLMHCHLTFHVLPHRPLGGETPAEHPDAHLGHVMHGMSGLVLGIEVPARKWVLKATPARRTLRLLVNEADSVNGEYQRRFGFVLHEPDTPPPARDSVPLPGSTLVLRRDEPVRINVVNTTRFPTSVHWHGIELESFYDGASGFGGYPKQITPAVAPQDSFAVYMTPPRAGTFIYHTHVDEGNQQPGGLYGPLIVLPPGAEWPGNNRVILLSTPRNPGPGNAVLINGRAQPEPMVLRAGQTYTVRLINITMALPMPSVRIRRDGQLVQWRALAEDGADLEPHQSTLQPADLLISIGKTFDFALTVAGPGAMQLEVVSATGRLLRVLPIVVE